MAHLAKDLLGRNSPFYEDDMPTARILERTRAFRELGIWPHVDDFNVEAWLDNFSSREQAIAERLLLAFCYFNDRMTDALFRAALQNQLIAANGSGHLTNPPLETDLMEIAFVVCEGEEPHPTDSGNLFSRKLRDKIRVPEIRIMSPNAALREAHRVKHFIFFDDFVGSGNQFFETMHRQHEGMTYRSFSEMHLDRPGCIGYSPCIATSKSIDFLSNNFPNLPITPSHILRAEHSALHANSPIREGMNWQEGVNVIREASLRAGYDAEDGGLNDWRGFHKLA